MRTCVIFNPVAQGGKARRFRRHLGRLGGDAVFRATTRPGGGRELAAAAVHEGFEVLASAGGDGTLNEVLNGIGDVPDGFSRVALGVIPLGTANVFARELGLPLSLSGAWKTLQSNRRQRVDLGRAEFTRQGRTEQRWFVQLAGAGLDARATELVSWNLKKSFGFAAYVVAALKALAESQPRIVVRVDDRSLHGELVLFGNGRLYGGPFTLFPGASLTDGRLDVRVFPRASPGVALRCVGGLLTGRQGLVGGTTDLQATAVQLTAEARTPLELDGECVGELPARLELHPGALQVVTP